MQPTGKRLLKKHMMLRIMKRRRKYNDPLPLVLDMSKNNDDPESIAFYIIREQERMEDNKKLIKMLQCSGQK